MGRKAQLVVTEVDWPGSEVDWSEDGPDWPGSGQHN